jgi:outer membrane protein OmpA-like peptidoglycan-associated protein
MAALIGVAVAAPGVSAAQTTSEMQTPANQSPETDTPSTDAFVERLANGATELQLEAPRLRRITITTGGSAREVVFDQRRAVSLRLPFAYDSAELTPTARHMLDRLGRALRADRLAQTRVVIAGHTGARGPATYNMDLSLRRAQAAKYYLVERWNIAPSRLVTHGWGESAPLYPDAPTSAENHRVEVTAVVSAARLGARRSTANLPCASGGVDPRPVYMNLDDFGGGGSDDCGIGVKP